MNKNVKELLTAGGMVGLLFGLSSKKDEDGVELKLFEKKVSFQEYEEKDWVIGSGDGSFFIMDDDDKAIFKIIKAIAYGGNINVADIDTIDDDGDCFNIQANGKTYHAKFLVVKKCK